MLLPDRVRLRIVRLSSGTRARFVESASEMAVRRSVEGEDLMGELAGDVVGGTGVMEKLRSVGVRAVDWAGWTGGMERVGGVEGWGAERGMISGVGARRGMKSTAA